MRRKSLSPQEKLQILQQRPFCFICEKPISESDLSKLDFDHIRSLDASGTNELTNYAAIHKTCHVGKRTKGLEDYKEELRLEKEFSSVGWFTDVAKKLNPAGEYIQFNIDLESREIIFGDGDKARLYRCPNTNLLYFYHPIPRKYLESDVEVQPRGLEQKRLRNLTISLRHNFQLSPTVCRLVTTERKIKVFDGQHKATAQAIGNQNDTVDCKVFIDPPLQMVRRVVIEGHGPLRQQEFKTSELFKKLTANYLDQLRDWQTTHQGSSIREIDLPQALSKTKDEAIKDIKAWIIETIISEEANCEITDFVSKERRPLNKPMTYEMLSWWINLLIKKPLAEEPMESEANFREEERENIIRLLNYVTRFYLQGKWTPNNPENIEHKKARRLFYRASFREWTKLLNDALRAILFAGSEKPIFYRKVSQDDWQKIETIIDRLATHPIWMDPNPQVEATLNSNIQQNVKRLFDDQQLDLRFLMLSPP